MSAANSCYNFRKDLLEGDTLSIECVQYLTKLVTHLKVPTSFMGIPFKYQRLYIKYLDCKCQSIEGVFKNPASRKWGEATRQHYRRVIKALLAEGWASKCVEGEKGDISLRSYPYVWRQLEIPRHRKWDRSKFRQNRRGSGEFYSYFKIEISALADERKAYYEQIKGLIQRHVAERKRKQINWRLKKEGSKNHDQATFSAKSSASLFGYKSPSSGSKLRQKYFSVIPSTEKPGFNRVRGRWEEGTKRIAL